MRRAFTLQLHDAVNPDECIRGDCEGPCPVVRPLPWTLTQCVACARRRLGIGHGRMSAWWPAQPSRYIVVTARHDVMAGGPVYDHLVTIPIGRAVHSARLGEQVEVECGDLSIL